MGEVKITLRAERDGDAEAIRAVHGAAFPTATEAALVDALRATGDLAVSLVAVAGGEVVGHIAFSPVRVAGAPAATAGMGLAPVAVLPGRQRQGIGARLIRAGLEACRAAGVGFVVVLGEPDYYHRFGFQRASGHRLANEYGVDEPFMVLALGPDALPASGGLVRYAPAFAALAD